MSTLLQWATTPFHAPTHLQRLVTPICWSTYRTEWATVAGIQRDAIEMAKNSQALVFIGKHHPIGKPRLSSSLSRAWMHTHTLAPATCGRNIVSAPVAVGELP